MIPLQPQGLRRADYLEPFGTLAVVRPAAPDAPLDAAAPDDLEPGLLIFPLTLISRPKMAGPFKVSS